MAGAHVAAGGTLGEAPLPGVAMPFFLKQAPGGRGGPDLHPYPTPHSPGLHQPYPASIGPTLPQEAAARRLTQLVLRSWILFV